MQSGIGRYFGFGDHSHRSRVHLHPLGGEKCSYRYWAYESYFGEKGIHRTRDTEVWKKTGESYLLLSDIFPEQLPDSAKVEEFYYEYYNPWDPCYLSFLVYHCDENDYDAEKERFKADSNA